MKNFLALTLFIFTSITYGYTVKPIIQSFNADGKGSSKSFLIENSGDTPISLEFEITTRSIDKNGKETRVSSDDFMVYPLQMTLKANSKRNIRVSWIGNKSPKSELPYRMIVRQLPIAKKGQTGVKFLFEYVASLYVLPKNPVEPKISARILGELKKGTEKLLRFQLANNGKKHAITTRYNISLTDGKNSVTLKEKDFVTPLFPNFLPGTEQIGTIRLPQGINPRTAKLTVIRKK